jgi:hypothetical protein
MKVKTLPFTQLKERILSGNVSLIKIASDAEDGFTIKNLKSLDIDSITLEYRLNSSSSQVLPFYRVHGTVVNQQNSVSTIEFLTPAIITTAATQ